MSWSVYFFGKPEKVVEALEKQSTQLTGLSKEEYDEALPHLIGLAKQNFRKEGDPMIKLNASGHGSKTGDEHTQRQCQVSLEIVYGMLV